MEKNNKTSELVNNIFLFFIANFLPKAITFFMVPLYTYCLTTNEYGTVDLIITTIQLLLPILTLGVQDAMLRFAMEKSNKKTDVLTIGMRIVVLGTIVLFVCCNIGKCFGIIKIDTTYLFLFEILYFAEALRCVISYFCRGIDKISILTISNILMTFVTVICNLIFLLKFKWGITGYLSAMCIGNIVAVLIMFIWGRIYKYIKLTVYDKKLTKSIISFSIPLIFSALAWWVNTSLDKYILNYFYGASSVGLMAVAYKIPSILSLFGTTIANAYSISAIKEFDRNDTDGFLGKSYSLINTVFVVMSSFLMLINIYISKILFSKEFFEAWNYVPPLLLSALVSQLSLTCQQYYIAMKKTTIISITAIIGALINLIANILLIPKYSAYGAGIATALSFFIVWLIRYIILVNCFRLKLKHNFKIECITYVLLIIQLILAYFGEQFISIQFLIFICIVIIYLKNFRDRSILNE